MLIRASGHLENGLFLFALGESCFYALSAEPPPAPPSRAPSSGNKSQFRVPRGTPFVIFDPGTSAHVELLGRRLETVGLELKNLAFVLLTHLHPERMSGLPLLKKIAPQAQVLGSKEMVAELSSAHCQATLAEADRSWRRDFGLTPLALEAEEFRSSLRIDAALADSELVEIGEHARVRALSLQGHVSSSMAYFIEPHEYLIADEVLGYYRGRSLAAPGPDQSLELTKQSLSRILSLPLRGLGLSFGGALTGKLVARHLNAVQQTVADIEAQVRQARLTGMPPEVVQEALLDQLYRTQTQDPLLRLALNRSFKALSGLLEP